jgi:hypothetical protein
MQKKVSKLRQRMYQVNSEPVLNDEEMKKINNIEIWVSQKQFQVPKEFLDKVKDSFQEVFFFQETNFERAFNLK